MMTEIGLSAGTDHCPGVRRGLGSRTGTHNEAKEARIRKTMDPVLSRDRLQQEQQNFIR